MALLFALTFGQAFAILGPPSVESMCRPMAAHRIHNQIALECYKRKDRKYLGDLSALCADAWDVARKMSNPPWQSVIECLDLIEKKQASDFPKKQVDHCRTLLEKTKKPAEFVFCLGPRDPDLLAEVCGPPLKIGAVDAAVACMRTLAPHTSRQLNPQVLVANCRRPSERQQIQISTWPTFLQCLTDSVANIPPDPSLQPIAGSTTRGGSGSAGGRGNAPAQ